MLQAGCAGVTSNPATAPAPIAEIPASLTIPSTVEIDTSKTASPVAGAPVVFQTVGEPSASTLSNSVAKTSSLTLKNAVGNGTYTGGISFSSNISIFANIRMNGILQPLNAIDPKIPVSADLHQMDTLVFIGNNSYSAHLDFGDFDIDGDGNLEGCSGNTLGLPICIRVYIQGYFTPGEPTRFLAARFDSYPTETNKGAGTLRGHDVSFGGYQVRADYNHVDPEDKFTDIYAGFLYDPVDPLNPAPDRTYLILRFRAFVSQLGPDTTALKTANGSSPDQELSGPGYSGKGFGRWFENLDLWRGSFESNTDPSKNFEDLCAIISTAEAALPSQLCADNGLNLQGLEFLPDPVKEDVEFFDFPATPPPTP
ncbi:MAG: hypothetical protein K8R69_10760 [Deltaproteobacteria bacterium]|nr:hypothetical protein [Deltaproteobacteria bacterium]